MLECMLLDKVARAGALMLQLAGLHPTHVGGGVTPWQMQTDPPWRRTGWQSPVQSASGSRSSFHLEPTTIPMIMAKRPGTFCPCLCAALCTEVGLGPVPCMLPAAAHGGGHPRSGGRLCILPARASTCSHALTRPPACLLHTLCSPDPEPCSHAAILPGRDGQHPVGCGCTAGAGASLQDIEQLLAPHSQRPSLATTATHPVSVP